MLVPRRHTLLAVAVLLAAGMVRAPVEQALAEEWRAAELLRRPLQLEVRQKLGQGFWAVSLGGLRTLVATVLNLRAFAHFENYEWVQVADTYDTIVQLAPQTRYYWETGSWHMAYNAASYFQRNDRDLPPIRARGEWQRWIRKGIAFLEEGLRQNPDDAMLWTRLGWLHMDPNKLRNYDQAVEAFGRALETGEAMPYVRRFQAMAMARSERYFDQALPTVRRIMAEQARTPPTLRSLRFVLEQRADPTGDLDRRLKELFASDAEAYEILSAHYLDRRSGYPQDGVVKSLRKLEKRLGIPEEQSVFGSQDPPAIR